MRALLLLCVFSLGVCVMSTAEAQEKKPSKAESYDEKCTVRAFNGEIYIKPAQNIAMYRVTDAQGKQRFYVQSKLIDSNQFKSQSEITDKDGVVWIVDEVKSNSTYYLCYVRKKPKD